ncbi:hypothetical protein Slin15195_G025080 [Septoria linicola]|uniref:Uncharacterized protein n=1 Tax=Septoria linicola TaxID=215465 RepID=A0A9Q9AGW7_9PEZI|nr:hypothetical protein Slin15195_G025080 [Septoria linicola]
MFGIGFACSYYLTERAGDGQDPPPVIAATSPDTHDDADDGAHNDLKTVSNVEDSRRSAATNTTTIPAQSFEEPKLLHPPFSHPRNGLSDASSPASATSQSFTASRLSSMSSRQYVRKRSTGPMPGHRRDFSGSAAWPKDLPMAWPPAEDTNLN